MPKIRALTTTAAVLISSALVAAPQAAPPAVAAGSGAEMYFINMSDSGRVAIHNATPLTNYTTFSQQYLTVQHDIEWWRHSTAIGDFNADGADDLYYFDRNDNGRMSVHVLDGATKWQSYLHHVWTPAPATPAPRYELALGDRDGDKRSDVFIIDREDGAKTSVHILFAANGYGVLDMQNTTVLHETSGPTWNYGVGDFDGDAIADIYAINDVDGASTSVHVLRGVTQYQDYGIQTPTALHAASEAKWKFRVGDYDGDNRSDIYAFNTSSNGMTDVHVLGAQRDSSGIPFQNFLLHATTAMHDTSNPVWDVQLRSTLSGSAPAQEAGCDLAVNGDTFDGVDEDPRYDNACYYYSQPAPTHISEGISTKLCARQCTSAGGYGGAAAVGGTAVGVAVSGGLSGAAPLGGTLVAGAAVLTARLSISDLKALAATLDVPWPDPSSTTAKKYWNTRYKVYQIWAPATKDVPLERTYKFGITRQAGGQRPASQVARCSAAFDRIDGKPINSCKWDWVLENVSGWWEARAWEALLAMRYKVVHGQCPIGMPRCL